MSQSDRMPDYRVTRETSITRDTSSNTGWIVVAVIIAAAVVIGLFYLVGHSNTTTVPASAPTSEIAPNPAAPPVATAPADNGATTSPMAPAPTDNGATPPATGSAAPPADNAAPPAAGAPATPTAPAQ